jgi:uncharacterized protein (UPF0335 family)
MADKQPDELNALKEVVEEFMQKMQGIENEIETLKEDRKELLSEYKEKLDTKTLNAALRTIKIRSKVEHKDAFDTFVEILTKE